MCVVLVLCRVLFCFVLLDHVIFVYFCYVMSCYVMLCCVMLCYVMFSQCLGPVPCIYRVKDFLFIYHFSQFVFTVSANTGTVLTQKNRWSDDICKNGRRNLAALGVLTYRDRANVADILQPTFSTCISISISQSIIGLDNCLGATSQYLN